MELRRRGFRIECGEDSLTAQGLVEEETIDRFLSKVAIVKGGHWRWTATIGRHGYGGFRLGRAAHTAHHAAYLLFVGPVPAGMDVDHLCHTKDCRLGVTCPHRACVQPTHLEAVPRGISLQRGAKRWDGKTCMRGHPWTPENTVERDSGRTCRICLYEGARRRYAEKVADQPKRAHHNAVKTRCPQGHEYTPENTIVRPNGSRACRECGREANRRSKAKKRGHHD